MWPFTRKETEFGCKHIKPWENSPWEFQECHCKERLDNEYPGSSPMDVSCAGKDCGYFEKKGK